MRKRTLAKFKPGVAKRTHLFLAALLWSIIGCILIARGIGWLMKTGQWGIAGLAVILGTCKSIFILDKTARKGVQRILNFADGTCVGAIYSFKTWLLVAVMISVGYFVRQSSLPQALLACVYITVGWGLFMSSRHAWIAWKNNPR